VASAVYKRVLQETGYLAPDGSPARGLVASGDSRARQYRAVFSPEIGLEADDLFFAQNSATSVFKDSGEEDPTPDQLKHWHETAWNIGFAPLLWIITPVEVRLYDCYAAPRIWNEKSGTKPLQVFALGVDGLKSLNAICGRVATETGAFWSSSLGSSINRNCRIDRELLAEIDALENELAFAPSGLSEAAVVDRPAVIRDLSQRFIGRCIFTWYLIDRGIAQRFLPDDIPADLGKIFQEKRTTFALFAWLRSTFDGDLFPMEDQGLEEEHLTDAHLVLLRDFVDSRSLVPEKRGQGRLFKFRFNAIPVDLISSIYQQFARSSAAEEAAAQGLHYTPIELVHLTLDPVFEDLDSEARIVDPTCGSGAFLVEAFRRLVWKATKGAPSTRNIVRRILYTQLFGIDVNKSALGIAAFSLYLAALEFDEESINDISDLRFEHLLGTTLFHADSLADELPATLNQVPFDAVVGNPPWTYVKLDGGYPTRNLQDEKTLRPRRSPDQQFLTVAASLAGASGRVGMIMKATPFFSGDDFAIQSRSSLMERLAPTALINLSFLRKEDLFPDASGPALLFFARCALTTVKERVLVGSIPWAPHFKGSGIFQIGPAEIKSVPLADIKAAPTFLKAATFGTIRDGWLIRRLWENFPTLEHQLNCLDVDPEQGRGQGYIVGGSPQRSVPPSYYKLPVVTPMEFRPLRIATEGLDHLERATLHRPRKRSIFSGPLVLCPKGAYSFGIERGRYAASIVLDDALYTQNLYGISFSGLDGRYPFVLSAILNSAITTFQLAFGGPTWGLERPTVTPEDILSLRVPDLARCPEHLLKQAVDRERALADSPHSQEALRALDKAVFDLYELEDQERVIVEDSVERARFLIFEGRSERCRAVKRPNVGDLETYALAAVATVNGYLRARGERHLRASLYDAQVEGGDLSKGIPGITAVRFSMAPGSPDGSCSVGMGDAKDLANLATLLGGKSETHAPPYLNERRHLRFYIQNSLFILKPSEQRYWTATAGLNDGDVVLADHWLQTQHAAA